MALGSSALLYADDFAHYRTTSVFVLLVLGGVLYVIGGVVYGLRRPNPFPAWFGFHEVFHTLTVVAFAAHFAGVWIATYSLR
jgi:hemolysin III